MATKPLTFDRKETLIEMARNNYLLKAIEVKEILGLSKETVYLRIKDGTIPSVRLGPHSLRVSARDLLRIVAPTESPTTPFPAMRADEI